jgi:hypothetical protein
MSEPRGSEATRAKLEELHAFESARLERVKERKTTMGLKAYLAGLRSVVADCQARSMFASARGDYDAMHALMKYEHAAAALMDAEFDAFVELQLLANRAAYSDEGLRELRAREAAVRAEGSSETSRAPDVTEEDVTLLRDASRALHIAGYAFTSDALLKLATRLAGRGDVPTPAVTEDGVTDEAYVKWLRGVLAPYTLLGDVDSQSPPLRIGNLREILRMVERTVPQSATLRAGDPE